MDIKLNYSIGSYLISSKTMRIEKEGLPNDTGILIKSGDIVTHYDDGISCCVVTGLFKIDSYKLEQLVLTNEGYFYTNDFLFQYKNISKII